MIDDSRWRTTFLPFSDHPHPFIIRYMAKPIRIIMIYGTKGGVGSSFISNNLALGIALGTKKPVLLLDIDTLKGGAQSSLLALENESNQKNLATICKEESINLQTIQNHIIPFKNVLHLIAAPPKLQSQQVTPDKLAAIFLAASQGYQHIVIDASQPGLTPLLAACLDFSTVVLPIVIPDIISLQYTSSFINQAEKSNFSLSRFRIVVNMANLSDDLPFDEISSYFQDFLKRSVEFKIPYMPQEIIKSINQGIPIIQKGKPDVLIQAFYVLIKQLLNIPPLDLEHVSLSHIEESQPIVSGINTGSSNRQILTETKSSPTAQHSDKPVAQSQALTVAAHTIGGWSPEDYKSLKLKLHLRLVKELHLDKLNLESREAKENARKQLRDSISKIILDEKIQISSRQDRILMIEEIIDEALGLGPLENLLKDHTITEIMVNGPNKIFVERQGKLTLTTRQFLDDKQLRVIIDRIVAPIGRRIDESSPMVDARLPDKSRVNIIIPPLALDGASITIRKFPEKRLTINDYIDMGTVSRDMADFFQGAVEAKLNVFISGGTGSGKTTLLNILSSFIPPGIRIVTIEDAAELQLHQEHVVRLESKPANLEGKGQVAIRDLVKNALRMRPDRIVVGEVRGGEALDMLQAMNTGHDGSLTTGHANTPRDALSRLETMVLMANVDLPIKAIREQIASAIDLIVHQSRMRDGSRKILNVVEVQGMDGDKIIMQDIFNFEQSSIDPDGRVIGSFQPADIRPKMLEKFVQYGVEIPDIFSPESMAKRF